MLKTYAEMENKFRFWFIFRYTLEQRQLLSF